MESDFQRLKEVIGDPMNPKPAPRPKLSAGKVPSAPKLPGLSEAIGWLVHRLQPISLFRLHKLLYLAEVESREVFSEPFLSIFFIRQKDGPFAPEVTKAIQFLQHESLGEVRTSEGIAYWSASPSERSALATKQLQVLESVAGKFGKLTNRGIKMAAYRRGPMVELLAKQKSGGATYNQSIF